MVRNCPIRFVAKLMCPPVRTHFLLPRWGDGYFPGKFLTELLKTFPVLFFAKLREKSPNPLEKCAFSWYAKVLEYVFLKERHNYGSYAQDRLRAGNAPGCGRHCRGACFRTGSLPHRKQGICAAASSKIRAGCPRVHGAVRALHPARCRNGRNRGAVFPCAALLHGRGCH